MLPREGGQTEVNHLQLKRKEAFQVAGTLENTLNETQKRQGAGSKRTCKVAKTRNSVSGGIKAKEYMKQQLSKVILAKYRYSGMGYKKK